MKVGDRVLLKRRPKGRDVPGIVRAMSSTPGEVFVEIRPGKLVPMQIKKLVVVPDAGAVPFHAPKLSTVPKQRALDALARLTEAERADVLAAFCRGCCCYRAPGEVCHCENDE